MYCVYIYICIYIYVYIHIVHINICTSKLDMHEKRIGFDPSRPKKNESSAPSTRVTLSLRMSAPTVSKTYAVMSGMAVMTSSKMHGSCSDADWGSGTHLRTQTHSNLTHLYRQV